MEPTGYVTVSLLFQAHYVKDRIPYPDCFVLEFPIWAKSDNTHPTCQLTFAVYQTTPKLCGLKQPPFVSTQLHGSGMWAEISQAVLLDSVGFTYVCSPLAGDWLLAGAMGLTEPCIHVSIVQPTSSGSFTL